MMNEYKSENDTDLTSSLCEDIIPNSPQVGISKKSKKRNQITVKKQWLCSGNPFLQESRSSILMNLQNPVCSINTKVYIFHTAKELFEYNSKNYLANNFVRLIGMYKASFMNIPYIQDIEAFEEKSTIPLNFKGLENIPKLDEVIEVYGQLNFVCVTAKEMPVIIVHFFNAIEGNIRDYLQCLKIQKKFLPASCLKLNEKIEYSMDSLIDFLQDLSITMN